MPVRRSAIHVVPVLLVCLLSSLASLSVTVAVAVVDADGHSQELELEETAVVVPPWRGATGTVEDLHREYGNIFRYGNRNAASHLWASFILDRAPQMTDAKLQEV